MQVAVLAIFYVLAGRLGLALSDYHDNVTLVWPPTGLALAALIHFGPRLWPGILAGVLLLNLSDPDLSFASSLTFAAGNALEALVGATLLVRVAGFRPTFERVRDVGAFLIIGVLGCTTVSATIGSTALLAFEGLDTGSFGTVWLRWWLGDAGGALIVAPTLLMLAHGTPRWSALVGNPEFWLALVTVAATSAFAFFAVVPGVFGLTLLLPSFPVLAWAGTRLGSRGAHLASFIIIVTAVVATASGVGPFALEDPTDQTVVLWAYSMLVGITAFTLAAVVAQRDIADQRHRAGEVERLRVEKEKLLLLERERLMREMHDGLGGQLVSLLSMVQRGLGTQSEVAEGLRRALDDIRIVIDSLDPSTTDLRTSLGKLRARLEPVLRRNGIALTWEVDELADADGLAPEAVLHLLRIIQESVTNALRHAGAGSIEVSAVCSRDGQRQLCITVCDDGQGMNPGVSPGGRGLENMRARARELDAVLEIEDANPGTQIRLRLRLPARASDRA